MSVQYATKTFKLIKTLNPFITHKKIQPSTKLSQRYALVRAYLDSDLKIEKNPERKLKSKNLEKGLLDVKKLIKAKKIDEAKKKAPRIDGFKTPKRMSIQSYKSASDNKISDVKGSITKLDLNIRFVENLLRTAKTELGKKNYEKTLKKLKKAEYWLNENVNPTHVKKAEKIKKLTELEQEKSHENKQSDIEVNSYWRSRVGAKASLSI